MDLKNFIHETLDFPIKGVLFRDISPMLAHHESLQYMSEKLVDGLDLHEVDYFAGIESRGFVLASLLASKNHKGFIPIRKAGKLPPPVIQQHYNLEYGSAAIEMHRGNGKIVIVDDVLATGGTLSAAILVAQKAGYQVMDVRVVINLVHLNNFTFNERKPLSLLEYSS